MSTHDTHGLLGAYVLDAVDDLERRQFERHLAECEDCAAELAGMRVTASHLAAVAETPPPPELKQRVMAQIGQVRQLPPVPAQRTAARRRRFNPYLIMGLAASLVIAVLISVVALRSTEEPTQSSQIAAVLAAPDAVQNTGAVTAGGTATVVTSRGRDQAVVIVTGVSHAPGSRTYQLWLMGPQAPRSVGTMDGADGPVLVSGLGDADQVGMTLEKQGGSPAPTTNPLFALPLA